MILNPDLHIYTLFYVKDEIFSKKYLKNSSIFSIIWSWYFKIVFYARFFSMFMIFVFSMRETEKDLWDKDKIFGTND